MSLFKFLSLSILGMLFLNAPIHAQKSHDFSPALKSTEFKMVFDKTFHEFGKVKKGDKKETQFVFTNEGTEDIVIEMASACECTTLDWPRKPVKPGEQGIINVIFDSTEKEESETIEIDLNLKNREKDTGYPRLVILSYSYQLVR